MKKILILPAVVALATCAHAAVFQYGANLTGSFVEPGGATGSLATGYAQLNYDNVAHTLTVAQYYWVGTASATVSHVHAATASPGTGNAGVALNFPGFPSGSSGTYTVTLDLTQLSTYSGSYASQPTASAAETALIADINAGKAYVNLHTSSFAGGEIGGFLAPVPEPGETAAVVGGLLGVFALVRRTRAKGQK